MDDSCRYEIYTCPHCGGLIPLGEYCKCIEQESLAKIKYLDMIGAYKDATEKRKQQKDSFK